ncbi:hypothetical protein O7626_41075 [Micromonospora sp. WMMD1102]|uniref:hypothetical protein n=1 Tax=Micromonospora sp. WMMD1102 TaxID=3016105 RepID=UPI002414ECF2|nr:hypothetical protein [Micromonospora sp. WMMD1102]MDG4784380.1 hypothetical protein [Micromonospora sp. WMMD1102]MDG4792198.1 hypothetical protein [Micromonospora sp. WMMD1102]
MPETVPQTPAEVRADQIQPGAILPLAMSGGRNLAEVVACTPYTDSDGAHMAALTATPVGGGEPQILRFRAGAKLAVATDAEVKAASLAPRSALFDVVRAGIDAGLPIPDMISMPSNNTIFKLHFADDSPLMVDAWAAHLGMPDAARSGHVVKGAGFRDFEPYESNSRNCSGLRGWAVNIDTFMTVEPETAETSTGDSSPSVAGAAGGTGPAAPSGPEVPASGPDTNAVEWPGERPAEPGEVCTCGRPATTVFLGSQFGDTGWCGMPQSADDVCPWCGEKHVGRCPKYKLRPDAPVDETAAEGARDDDTASVDATATDPERVDGRTSLPVRADAVPAAPRGMGAAGITPDADERAVFDRVTGAALRTEVDDDGRCPGCGHEAEHLLDAGCVARPGGQMGMGRCGCKHRAGITPRPSYDANPTLLTRPGYSMDQAYAEYATHLDGWAPGWYRDDQRRMAPGLAREAQARREAEQNGADQ